MTPNYAPTTLLKPDPIRTDDEYAEVLRRINVLMDWDPHPLSPAGEALKTLVDRAEAYERVRWPLPWPLPRERWYSRAARWLRRRLSPN